MGQLHFEEKIDTIVACATPAGKGAVAIIRLSGKNTKKIIQTLIVSKNSVDKWPARVLVHGFVADSTGKQLDEVLCSIMEAPKSYTGEDIAEIYCHGGEGIVKAILELAIKQGARLANPGEFTRRAYENGKLDITRAQVVQRIIEANTREELYGACRVLKGELEDRIKEIREKIVEALSFIEAVIDFPEEEDVIAQSNPRLEDLIDQFSSLICSSRKKIDRITEVVVAGRTNVGKSSIVNKLCNKKVSIVTNEPGTTRDAVEAEAIFGGIRVKLVDIAGQAQGSMSCEADCEAQAVAALKTEQADLVLWVGTDIIQMLQEAPTTKKNRYVLPVVNKIDLLPLSERKKCIEKLIKIDGLMVSALTGEGFDLLVDTITRKLLTQTGPADGIPISVWQEEAFERSKDRISKAADHIKAGSIELAAEDLRQALDQVNELLGEGIKQDVLDRIFERFCIGK